MYLTHVQQGITGFGSSVLALPFVTLLLGLRVAVPVLVIQAWVLTFYIAAGSWRKIVWREYFRILGFTAIGFPVGMIMASRLPEDILKWILAAFMVFVGIHGFFTQPQNGQGQSASTSHGRIMATSLLPIGGVIHGAYGSGGPLAVIYATKTLPDKTEFRGTLCAVWLTLGTILIIRFLAQHQINRHVLWVTALALPSTVIGMIMGNHWHYKINDRLFRILVYAVLILAGIVLGISILQE